MQEEKRCLVFHTYIIGLYYSSTRCCLARTHVCQSPDYVGATLFVTHEPIDYAFATPVDIAFGAQAHVVVSFAIKQMAGPIRRN